MINVYDDHMIPSKGNKSQMRARSTTEDLRFPFDPARFIVLHIDIGRGATVYVMDLDLIGRGHSKLTTSNFHGLKFCLWTSGS